MTTKIITDSGADAFMEDINGITHNNVPLTIRAGVESWYDDKNLDIPEFILKLKNTSAPTSTACPSVQDWMDAFEGADEIFILTITSALSGTYNSANQAVQIYNESHPDVKIHVFDTRSAGPQIRLLAQFLAKMINDGLTFDQIIETMKYKIKQTDLIFVLENLDNLANNGRISPAMARVAHVLKLNIFGTANDDGKFEMLGKTRGGKKMYLKMVKMMEKAGYNGGQVLIDHVQAPEKADELLEVILKKYPQADISISECGGLCSYYAEDSGLMVGFEK